MKKQDIMKAYSEGTELMIAYPHNSPHQAWVQCQGLCTRKWTDVHWACESSPLSSLMTILRNEQMWTQLRRCWPLHFYYLIHGLLAFCAGDIVGWRGFWAGGRGRHCGCYQEHYSQEGMHWGQVQEVTVGNIHYNWHCWKWLPFLDFVPILSNSLSSLSTAAIASHCCLSMLPCVCHFTRNGNLCMWTYLPEWCHIGKTLA